MAEKLAYTITAVSGDASTVTAVFSYRGKELQQDIRVPDLADSAAVLAEGDRIARKFALDIAVALDAKPAEVLDIEAHVGRERVVEEGSEDLTMDTPWRP